MSLSRYAKKRDLSEPAIVAALEAAGAIVFRIDRPVDLLVGWGQRWVLIECKTGKRRASPEQTATLGRCYAHALPIYLVRSPEDALQAIGASR